MNWIKNDMIKNERISNRRVKNDYNLCVQVRDAAAHKVKDFCLALDKYIQEQVIMNHLLPCVKVGKSHNSSIEFPERTVSLEPVQT